MMNHPRPDHHDEPHEQALNARAGSVWARVIEPGGPANYYVWDDSLHALTLQRVEHPAVARGADLARIPLEPRSTRSDDGAPSAISGPAMLAFILAEPPIAPGVWLRLRLLGALSLPPHREMPDTRDADEHGDALARVARAIAFGVPEADVAFESITAWNDLPPELRLRAEQVAQSLITNSREGQAAEQWLDAHDTIALYRAARVAQSRRAHARHSAMEEDRHERLTTDAESLIAAFTQRLRRDAPATPPETRPIPTTPASITWRGLSGVSAMEWRVRDPAALGEAENLLHALPQRFMRSLGALLAPDERVLFFVEAPPMRIGGETDGLAPEGEARGGWRLRPLVSPRGGGRLSTLQAGLLLITDRQALLLRDFAAPNVGATQQPGYIASSWPLGRVLAASAPSCAAA